MNILRLASMLALAFAITGCATPGKYQWGNYDSSLYQYYKDPSISAKHMTELSAIIESAAATNARVAPGIHAEYGYFLLQDGKAAEARKQFEMEKAVWPESSQFMTVMIDLADGKKTEQIAGQSK